jgi:HEAT repeat protein
MKSALFSVSLGIIILLAAPSVPAQADPLARARKALWSKDLKKAVGAAERLGRMRKAKALDLLMESLQLGAPTEYCKSRGKCTPNLAVALVKAIGNHKSPRAVNLLVIYTRNRNAKVRAQAVRALGVLADPKVAKKIVAAMVSSLSDRDVQVRMAAAWVIAHRTKKKLVLPARERLEGLLIKLLDRGDTAAPAIGLAAIGGYLTARHLAVNLKKLPEITIAKIYRSLLNRKDFGPDPIRQWIVRALAEIKGQHATEALANYAASPPLPGLKSVAMANQFMEK